MNIAGVSEPIPAPPKSTRFVLPRAPITPGSVSTGSATSERSGSTVVWRRPSELALDHHNQQLVWSWVLQPVADLRVDLLDPAARGESTTIR